MKNYNFIIDNRLIKVRSYSVENAEKLAQLISIELKKRTKKNNSLINQLLIKLLFFFWPTTKWRVIYRELLHSPFLRNTIRWIWTKWNK